MCYRRFAVIPDPNMLFKVAYTSIPLLLVPSIKIHPAVSEV